MVDNSSICHVASQHWVHFVSDCIEVLDIRRIEDILWIYYTNSYTFSTGDSILKYSLPISSATT
jgi:hypothetical protein